MRITNRDYVYITLIIVIIGLFCFLIVNSKYTLRLEMDDNTLEAIKTINWSVVDKAQERPHLNIKALRNMTIVNASCYDLSIGKEVECAE